MFEGILQDIEFDEGDNLGGMRGMRFVPPSYIDFFPPSVQGVTQAATTLFAGREWITWRAIEDTADFKDEERKGEGGTVWDATFTMEIASDGIDQRMVIDSAVRMEVIVEVTDNNGKVRRMGEMNSPAVLTARHSSGGATAARNAWQITVTCTHKRAAVFVPDWDARVTPYNLQLPDADDSSN